MKGKEGPDRGLDPLQGPSSREEPQAPITRKCPTRIPEAPLFLDLRVRSSRTVYGDDLASPDATKHRGRVYRSYAGGGESTVLAYDFKGQPTRVEQRLLLDPEAKNDWTPLASHTTIDAMAAAAALLLEDEQHVLASESTLDALGRPLTALSPDGSTVTYAYNQRGLLEALTCHHRGAATATPIVSAITYDVLGRQTSITRAANAAVTTHHYDPLTFRLRHIQTTRTADGLRLQDLRYHYDPVGNITDIQDHAQQTVYFQNQVVEAANSYVYDALYRLTEATGREHATQGTTQRSAAQLPPDSVVAPMANDPNALRRYVQRYSYDSVGNLTKVTHAPATGTGWTRHYQYATSGNRLVATSTPADTQGPLYSDTPTYSHAYAHDLHGNLAAMPHLQTMEWDELEQLHRVEVGSQTVYCQYAGGQRVRTFVVHCGSTTEERIYAGAFERYRKRVNGAIKEEWESLHVPGGVLVETRTLQDSAPVVTPAPVWRYQLSNHLGSATTEITETGAVISHEEYHPYGTSAYRMVDSQVDVPAKRYRFTGMERDEETGLSYHSARYYAPWLGRWTAADPIGLGDGVNRFAYVGGRPTHAIDLAGTNGEELSVYSNKWEGFANRAYSIGESEAQLDSSRAEQHAREARLASQLLSGGEQTEEAQATLDFLADLKFAERDIDLRRDELWRDINAARLDAAAANQILRSGFQIEAMSKVTGGIILAGVSAFGEAPTAGASTVGVIEGWSLIVQGGTESIRGRPVEDGLHVILRSMMEGNAAGADPDQVATLIRIGLGVQASMTQGVGLLSAAEETQVAAAGEGPKALLSPAPINIPRHASPITQLKGGYTQIKYKWRTESGVTVEARFHGPTPGAPEGSTANWRVSRTFPGTPKGGRKYAEHLVRRPDDSLTWVSNKTWYDAQKAYTAGTATEGQRTLLRGGHL